MNRRIAILGLAAAAIGFAAPGVGRASPFDETGEDIARANSGRLDLGLALRARSSLLYNLDLDHGLTPSGLPLFPVPLSNPDGQTLTHADMRLRMDAAAYPLGHTVAIKIRADVFDGVELGSLAEGTPTATQRQRPPDDIASLKQLYGQVLLPFGLLTLGRTPSHFGLGIVANDGSCADCDSGDNADRVAFSTPLAGHIWTIAYDLSSAGPRTLLGRSIDADPDDDARTFTLAVLNVRNDSGRGRRTRAGRATVEYGGVFAYRWQTRDVPIDYVPVEGDVPLSPAQSIARDYRAATIDSWARLTLPRGRVEFEAAMVVGRIGQASLIPGLALREPLDAMQLGGAIESDFEVLGDTLFAGLDAGGASGDPAPGFGAGPGPLSPVPTAGDLDGPQMAYPSDRRADNFRFHPSYRIDRILFREIIGTVTDAIYVRPHTRWMFAPTRAGKLVAELAAVASWAVEPNSTPNGTRGLGVELDPGLRYETEDRFSVALDYALLLPLDGFANAADNRQPRPAQLVRVRVEISYP